MNRVNKKIIVLCLMIIAVVSGTFAWVSWNSSSNTDVSVTIDDCTIVTYDGGPDIINSSIIPTLSKEDGIIKEITIKQENNCDVDSKVSLFLHINEMGEGLDYEHFKWELYKNGSTHTEGNFKGRVTGNIVNLTSDQKVTTSKDTYTLYLWIDGDVDNSVSVDNQKYDFSLYAIGSGRLEEN